MARAPKPVLLCIDDEASGLAIRKMLLESAGYRILTAERGRQGLEIFTSQEIDAVVLDYAMPEMDGYQVALEMRRLKPSVPIMMLSAYPTLPEDVLESVDLFVSKGLPPIEFFEQVKALLQTRKIARSA